MSQGVNEALTLCILNNLFWLIAERVNEVNWVTKNYVDGIMSATANKVAARRIVKPNGADQENRFISYRKSTRFDIMQLLVLRINCPMTVWTSSRKTTKATQLEKIICYDVISRCSRGSLLSLSGVISDLQCDKIFFLELWTKQLRCKQKH